MFLSPMFLFVLMRVVCCKSNVTVFIGLNACFKFKLKDCGFDDPDLGNGLAYMVADPAYKEHISRHAAAQQSTDVSPGLLLKIRFVDDYHCRASLVDLPSTL